MDQRTRFLRVHILEFGGIGSQADDINGNVYSGGNVVVEGDEEEIEFQIKWQNSCGPVLSPE